MIIRNAESKIKQYIKDSENLSFSVAVCRDGKTEKAFFAHDRDSRIFEAGSITKTLTCILLVNELHNHKIPLSQTIDKILDLPHGNYPAIEKLLTHRAGYGTLVTADENGRLLYLEEDIPFSFSENPFYSVTESDLLHTVSVFRQKPAQEYESEYSNFGLSVAGMMAEKLSGKSFRAMCEEFFRENGIHMFVGKPDSENVVSGYHGDENCGNWLWGNSAFMPCGSIYSDADGLISYGRYILSAKDKYPEIFTEYCNSFEKGNRQGLAFMHNPDGDIWWHNGGTGCFKTYLGVNFDKNIVAVTLSNQKARNGMTPEEVGFTLIRKA